jgi:cyclopropane-fatty-acyl-phospholipid synthase
MSRDSKREAQGWARKVHDLLASADVRIGGDRPWDIHVHDDRLYRRVLMGGSLALGESYMDAWWDCEALDELFHRVLSADLDAKVIALPTLLGYLRAKLFNLQKPSRAFAIGERHYDRGNRLFSVMLDRRLVYSCAYWRDADCLDAAQEAKLDLVCRKLALQPGMRLLDIGCGWGSAVSYAAERYGVDAVGITVSKEQARWAQEAYKELPVDIRLQDYRDVDERFDRILSIGMFEHVGHKNYRTYMRMVRRCLADDGLFLLQTISRSGAAGGVDPWISCYIFPNSVLPSARGVSAAMEGLFVLEDWQNLGTDYDRTLMAWFFNFEDGWRTLRGEYDDRFYRMWKYYLLSCAGAFRARKINLWQIVLSPSGVPGGYRAVR